MTSKSTCPKCGGRMEEGHVIDEGYGAWKPAKWQAGKPQMAWYGSLKVDKKALKQVENWRCGRCGFLESYAP